MGDFFIRTFLKNPKGLIVLGIVCIAATYVAIGIAGPIIGVIITIVGFIWLKKSNKKIKASMSTNSVVYNEIVSELKNCGYEINEFENKKDRIRSNVYLNGNRLGEIFLVAPPPSGRYAQFKRIEDMNKKDFKYNYSKINKTNPGIPSSYWPDNSLIGAMIEESANNCSDKGKWLTDIDNIFKTKSS